MTSVHSVVRALLGPVAINRHVDREGLKKEIAPFTFLDGLLQGRPDYAATWYNWGDHSPYIMHDAFFLLCGAVLSALCLPALLIRWVGNLLSGMVRGVDPLKEATFELLSALQMLIVGAIRGAILIPIAVFADSAKWITMKRRDRQFPQEKKSAILAVDMQKDFFPGGTLAVKGADEIIPILKTLIAKKREGVRYFASQDWHPENHGSFAPNLGVVTFSETMLNGVPQVAWPVHCVAGTPGAEFVEGMPAAEGVIQKAQDPRNDSYSAVLDNGKVKKKTKLMSHLRAEGIQRLFICGVATDYCVRETAKDLREQGLEVIVIGDACRGVYAGLMEDARASAEEKIKAELTACGAVWMPSQQVIHAYPEQFTS